MVVKVVCPYCMAVNRVPKKEHYAKVNCGQCKRSLLDAKPIESNRTTFDTFVEKSDLPVVVDFWAPWCGPCRMMAPAFEEAASALALKAQFLKVNTENEPELGSRYGIRSIPTLLLFKNGREADRISGALGGNEIRRWVERYI